MSKIYEIEAVIEYRVTVDVEADNPADAMDRFNRGNFREIYLPQAEMSDWEATSKPREVEP